jgi:exodeoxyribonuclease VII small subunit
LEEIVTQIKAKDMPLEKSLDLYEEALQLGSACAEMIDRTDFSADELEYGLTGFGETDDLANEAEAGTGRELEPDGVEGVEDAEDGDADDGDAEDGDVEDGDAEDADDTEGMDNADDADDAAVFDDEANGYDEDENGRV